MFKDKLYYILDDLSKHKKSKCVAFKDAVQERLDMSTKVYENELQLSTDYLSYRDALVLLKRMNRE